MKEKQVQLEIQQNQEMLNRSHTIPTPLTEFENDNIVDMANGSNSNSNSNRSMDAIGSDSSGIAIGDQSKEEREQQEQCAEGDDDYQEIPFLNDDNIRLVR